MKNLEERGRREDGKRGGLSALSGLRERRESFRGGYFRQRAETNEGIINQKHLLH